MNLKKNIIPTTYGLNTLMQLKPVEYNWNSDSDSSQKSMALLHN